MGKNLLNKYVWLIGVIYSAGKISLEEINRRWLDTDMSDGVEIPRRTFHNWRAVIEELFDVNICCDKFDGYKYYIENEDDIRNEKMNSWLLNTMAVSNMIQESRSISDRILLEDIPSGKVFLSKIVSAMKGNAVITFTHQTFKSENERFFSLEPYCVKEHHRRWYVLGRSVDEDRILIFGLDRIRSLSVTDQKFVLPSDFDAETFFSEFYGVVVDRSVPLQQVRVKVSKECRDYLRTLPLHHSQKEVETNSDYSVFEYSIRPTHDFLEQLSHKGEIIENSQVD